MADLDGTLSRERSMSGASEGIAAQAEQTVIEPPAPRRLSSGRGGAHQTEILAGVDVTSGLSPRGPAALLEW